MKDELNLLGVHVLSVRISSVLVYIYCQLCIGTDGWCASTIRTSSVLIHMIDVHLLSVKVVYLVENETLGLHLLSVGTSSRFSQNK